MQSHHSSQVREAIMTLRVNGFPYEKIAKSINNAGLGPISKDTVCYNVKKYEETNSVVNRPKTGRPCNKRTPQMFKNTCEKIWRSVKRFGLHALRIWMWLTLQFGESWPKRLAQNSIKILTASNLPSRLHGKILIKKWSVPAAGMHAREWRLWWRLMEDIL